MELCSVPSGQIMRRQVPPEKTRDVLEFATKKPSDRLESIRRGLQASTFIKSTATSSKDD
jgi:eukaryotic translation initiation factor 2C